MTQWRLLVPNKTRKVRVNESDILRSVKFELLTKTHLWSNFKSEIYWDQEVESFESTYWLYRAVTHFNQRRFQRIIVLRKHCKPETLDFNTTKCQIRLLVRLWSSYFPGFISTEQEDRKKLPWTEFGNRTSRKNSSASFRFRTEKLITSYSLIYTYVSCFGTPVTNQQLFLELWNQQKRWPVVQYHLYESLQNS